MKFYQYLLSLVFALAFCAVANAQDTLPNFSVRNAGKNRIIIGWVNTLKDVKQISIQRSFDSIRNYKTILSVADPKAVQNGFADTKAPADTMFYRLFYVLEGGRFYFTEAKKPNLGPLENERQNGVRVIPITPGAIDSTITKRNNSFTPSFYVYTNNEGYVFINLPDADKKKYRVKFFEENDDFLFEIKQIKETGLTIDKANFYHAGWFKFELYNDEKLIEKNKFYINKSF